MNVLVMKKRKKIKQKRYFVRKRGGKRNAVGFISRNRS